MRSAPFCALLLSLSCAQHDYCSPRTLELTGDPAHDVPGTWGWFGIDTPVVMAIHADGGWNEIELTSQIGGVSQTPVGNGAWFPEAGSVAFSDDFGVDYGSGSVTDAGLALDRVYHPLDCPGITP